MSSRPKRMRHSPQQAKPTSDLKDKLKPLPSDSLETLEGSGDTEAITSLKNECEASESADTNSRTNDANSMRTTRSTRKRPRNESDDGDNTPDELIKVVLVPRLAKQGWAGRWNTLMQEYQLSTANALAELLVNAYDACTCRPQSGKADAEQEPQELETPTTETSVEEKQLLSPLPAAIKNYDPKQKCEINTPLSCPICKKMFKTARLLHKHSMVHQQAIKTICPAETKEIAIEKLEEKEQTPVDPISSELNETVDNKEKENEIVADLPKDNVSSSTDVVIRKRTRVARKDDATGEVIGEIVVAGKDERRKIRVKRERCYTCEHCGKNFNNGQLLKHHVRTHTGERPLQCNTCGKRFIDHKALLVHNRIHTGVRPYSCAQCKRTFTQASNYKRHLASVHDKRKQFLCQFCDARFARLEHLRNHENSHLGIKPFSCVVCGHEFASLQHLQRHAVVHTGFLPFRCTHCDRSFDRKDRLDKHLANHQGTGRGQIQHVTCCIMKADPEKSNPESQPTSQDTTPKHVLKSIRKLSAAQTPQTTPKIQIARDPSGKSDRITHDPSNSDPKRTVLSSTVSIGNSLSASYEASNTSSLQYEIHNAPDGVVKNDPSFSFQVSNAPSEHQERSNAPSEQFEISNTPAESYQTANTQNKAYIEIGKSSSFQRNTANMDTSNGNAPNPVAIVSSQSEESRAAESHPTEYVTYADASESHQLILDTVLSTQESSSLTDQQQQQQHQLQPQEQIVYYKSTESGEFVEISSGHYASAMDPVLYQQEVEVQEENSTSVQQQQVYVVHGGEAAVNNRENMIVALEDGGDLKDGVHYVFQTN